MSKRSLRDRILDILFPRRCPFCDKLLAGHDEYICATCQKELPWLIGPDAVIKFEFVTMCVSPLRYQNQVRDSIHRYKFSDRSLYSSTYGHFIAQCVCDHLSGRFDIITWVPLSKKRLRKRGYDQAKLLAESVAGELNVETVCTLRKCRNTSKQSGLDNVSERRANVLGAYNVTDEKIIKDKRILLIDDVVTTGSTLSECARVLRTFGAADVVCATLCQAKHKI